jgi:sensor histidine kinase regulating citrate/malate metabolism
MFIELMLLSISKVIHINAIFLQSLAINLVIYFVYLIFRKKYKPTKNIDNKTNIIYNISLIVIPLGSIIIGNVALTNYSFKSITSAVILIFINILVFYFYDYIVKSQNQLRENTIFEQQNAYYRNQLKILYDMQEEVKSIRHDMKNHLIFILSNSENEKNREYLENILQIVKETNNLIQTGNAELDSYINYKLGLLSAENQKTDVSINFPIDCYVEVFDVITILGNLLDNAFEAINSSQHKYLFLKVEYTESNVTIVCKNTFDKEIDLTLKTKKSDKFKHGYGLKNIKKTVAKYDGIFDTTIDEEMFIVKVILFNK